MKKLLEWISKHKKTTITLCGLAVFLPILLIHILFKIKTEVYWMQAEWQAGEVLGYFGDVLSFVGTIVLGCIAISQTEKANKLNEELLNIEKDKLIPRLDIEGTQLYKIYLENDMYEQFSKIDRTDRMVVEMLYTLNPRTGIVTDSALLELEVFNNGGSDIRRIYINSSDFYLCVNDPNNNDNKKIATVVGNTSLSVGEKRTLYIYAKREINNAEELNDKWYEQHSAELMPHIELEMILETTSGERYLETIAFGSGWDASMQRTGNTVVREIGVVQMDVSKIEKSKQ